MSAQPDLRLRNGSRIVVVGAGPAGTFFAHYARQFAREQGLDVDIVICDGKNFSRQGPIGCNMCAGVISGPLTNHLAALDITLPNGRVQHQIDGYFLQTAAGGFALDHPDGERTIRTVFRGNGPRFAAAGNNVSFDDFLLDHVKAEGISMLPFPVHEINLSDHPGELMTVVYGDKDNRTSIVADLVVGAFGLNTPLLEKTRALGFGYQPPRSRRVCQAELPVGRDWIAHRLQNRVVVLTLRVGSVRLGILTPKGDHLTVTLLGRSDVKLSDLHAVLEHPQVRALLPPDWTLPESYCHCFPRLAVTASRRPYTDRLVLIGDASFSRYYKNGIESALVTAHLAAATAFRCGVSERCFQQGYLKPARRLIVRDNLYGRVLFRLRDLVSASAALAAAQQDVALAPEPDRVSLALRRGLWNVITGDAPYRAIFWQLCDPRLLLRLGLRIVSIYVGRLKSPFRHARIRP